jgi:hypothetical protein
MRVIAILLNIAQLSFVLHIWATQGLPGDGVSRLINFLVLLVPITSVLAIGFSWSALRREKKRVKDLLRVGDSHAKQSA